MNKRIVIIDDIPDILLEKILKDKGFEVNSYQSAEEALNMLQSNIPDLILLDLNLPAKSGFEILKEIIKLDLNIPIIILSAKDATDVKVIGLEMGAADYVTKPFDYDELVARINVNFRKMQNFDSKRENEDILESEDLYLDFSSLIVKKNGETISLTHYEMLLLEYLYKNIGKVVARENIIEKIWGKRIHVSSKTIDNHINRLRKKIENDCSMPRYIVTVYGKGYKFNFP